MPTKQRQDRGGENPAHRVELTGQKMGFDTINKEVKVHIEAMPLGKV